jgi:transcription factor C subunit 3
MDELVRHCLRELAFDGDLGMSMFFEKGASSRVRNLLGAVFSRPNRNSSSYFSGCNVSRLKDFIVDFYATSLYPQNADDSFCAFVWSLVVQQPSVRIGTVPAGITSEVWVAPQVSAKRKATAKGEEFVPVTPFHLDIVPDAKSRQLSDLISEYGDQLRIALDPDSIYAAITGTHLRASFRLFPLAVDSQYQSFQK